MADELHSDKDIELERRDQQIFRRVVILAAIAGFIIIVAALVFTGRAGKWIHPVNPDKHPSSEVISSRPGFQDA